jgi:phosphoheptose isomerase
MIIDIDNKMAEHLRVIGSAADSQHLAAELVGRFTRERRALASVAITTDSSILTALGRDRGRLRDMVDHCVRVPSKETARIQEAHILIGHLLCDWVEASFVDE